MYLHHEELKLGQQKHKDKDKDKKKKQKKDKAILWDPSKEKPTETLTWYVAYNEIITA